MKHTILSLLIIAICWPANNLNGQSLPNNSLLTIARLKYAGGGDWYNDPSIIPNLLNFIRQETTVLTAADEKKVEIMDQELFSYPILFLTGHGKIALSDDEVARLRLYLTRGGFLYADDDYGMDKFFRDAMKKVFPDKELVELPFQHPIYHCHFHFDNGVPKIHEHDGGPPHAYGIFHEGRMVVYYTFNTNISDGWADPEVHHDPEEIRLQALKMGVNIVIYALTY
ncbi:MAG: DUF4159 domain-containing protein [candidate division KSB1 bacterium]|nr:DUF4159 domain-containing protein [candidate division KSB1 bacterium]MDZ7318592.1 DUF4159 domain-containing protein [candidate division KSB1 bacterium]